MRSLSELLLALITNQAISPAEKREIALHILRLVRLIREGPEADGLRRDATDA